MSTQKISAMTAANSIDASNDYLPIVQSAANKKINRNTLLGLSSAPLGTTDSQSPTNKTLDNTNTVTLKDTLFTLQDDGDTTKQAKFQLSGITTSTTRTYTLPNASSTLADIATSQTFTNKTLTSPTITGGTIDNSTITVDSISGHTSGTIVTVANLQISNGVLNSANAVTATSIAVGAVQPQALVTGTGSGWAWQTWAPTWTNLTAGNGTLSVAKYTQIGKTVHFKLKFIFGTTSSMSSGPTFTLPVTATTLTSTNIGRVVLDNNGGTTTYGSVFLSSTTVGGLVVETASASYVTASGITSTIPYTWATGMFIDCYGTYEAA